MGKKKKQYYIVVEGHKPGIYNQWFGESGAADQVEGYPKAVYKGFHTLEDAVRRVLHNCHFLYSQAISLMPASGKLNESPRNFNLVTKKLNSATLSVRWLKQLNEETLAKLPPDLADLLISPEIGPTYTENLEAILETGKVVIHTDGGADPNPGPGGYGVVLRYKEHKRELSGGFRLTTNNRMELLACIEGLRALKQECEVVLYSDSKYIVDSVMKGWAKRWQANGWKKGKKRKIKNVDLWEQLLELCEQHNVEFKWVRGHTGIPDNEKSDELAVEASRKHNLSVDVAYETGETQMGTLPLFSS